MTEYVLPIRVVEDARRGIAAVQRALAARGLRGWSVWAVRAAEIDGDRILYLVTLASSMPLTRRLAYTVADRSVWISGRVEANWLPIDLGDGADPDQPITALELWIPLRPKTGRGPGVGEGTSILVALIDAAEGVTVQLTLATERRIPGWPR